LPQDVDERYPMAMSNLSAWMKRAVPPLLRARPPFSEEEASYRRLVSKGWEPSGIIDVGAYHGAWTRMIRRIFPKAPVLMVEAQKRKAARLEALCMELGNVTFASAVLGSEAGREVAFFEMETGSSYFPERSNAPRIAINYVTRTLDEVAHSMAGSLFLKVDVQGAELEVLAGGQKTLDRCEVVQLEAPVVTYNEGAPSLLEVIRYMDERDFVPVDVSGFSRPNGVDLVQMDLLFVRRASPLRTTFVKFEQFD
jgi:FkbM family methyltransferase